MIKQDIFSHDVKAQFQASAKDRMHRFLMADDQIKGAVVHATRMVKEMQANHALGPLETLVLGQAYIAATLMCSGLKGRERLGLSIQCSGPVKGLDVEANAFGEVRGFLKANPIRVEHPDKVRRLSTLYGAGFLTVTKYLEDAGVPYSGQIALAHGSVAEDLAEYFLQSEQIPTGFKLSVTFDADEAVVAAGGIFLQALPGVDPEKVAEAETLIQGISSLGDAFSAGRGPEEVINDVFSGLKPRFLDSSRVEFFCRCNQERMQGHLKALGAEDREDIKKNGPFPLEIRCHHCNSVYRFTKETLASVL